MHSLPQPWGRTGLVIDKAGPQARLQGSGAGRGYAWMTFSRAAACRFDVLSCAHCVLEGVPQPFEQVSERARVECDPLQSDICVFRRFRRVSFLIPPSMVHMPQCLSDPLLAATCHA